MSDIKIEISSDAALVLFDWLARFTERDDNEFQDQAEQRVLFDLEAMLEELLSAPLASDYAALLAKARANIRDPESE